ncbi:electron transport complex protein RnfD [Dysgonomonas sp. PH5-45]|uniref:RnfABCDGE type electron transport complex subunit D n=1 Tax=unclassified Dysgonomonas TaxID=2630389 RepID=UPI00247517F0|nr:MULTISPECIES: RnfABCDGE type electron transport complex subunit D [unclassified Dysgonomonas]MDH6354792.1 electron transport complex protein RnfD [Dysgonomonas sp. PH5-45]MDH6387691.1 electron transport complex protein RnfD [Dysgonomonas sp. PH5-37]
MKNEQNIQFPPFVNARDNVRKVMMDVVIALLPCLAMSYLAFGFIPLLVVLVAVGSTVATEFLFSSFFLGRKDSVSDGSAIVTGVLLAMTLAPFTPLYVVAFGGAMAVIFGKLVFGGLGRNFLNPALVGREFMTVFFPAAMTSGAIWFNKEHLNYSDLNIFGAFGNNGIVEYLNSLFFKASGAIGEYSIFFIVLGGVYLLVKRRISWHIPFALLVVFFVMLWIFEGSNPRFSMGGLLLGTIFMATDMPSSASTKGGKLYYGAMIAVVAMICILNGVRYEYMSYSILLLNVFNRPITLTFQPRVWGKKHDWFRILGRFVMITGSIVGLTYIIIFLHNHDCIKYLLFAYIVGAILYFVKKGYSPKWS